MSRKELPKPNPVKVDKNYQISPDTSPNAKPSYTDKNLQISSKDAPSLWNKSNILKQGSNINSNQSDKISREMSKLENNGNRREKFKTSKEVPRYKVARG